MRQILFTLIALVIFCNCRETGITIYAPPELAEATLFIDGKPCGRFDKAVRSYRWVGWKKMKGEISAPPRSEATARLSGVSAGEHKLRIESAGYEPIEKQFRYAGSKLEIEVDDALLKPVASVAP